MRTNQKAQLRKEITDKLSPGRRGADKDVIDVREAMEVMKRSQEIRSDRLESLFRQRSYLIFRFR